MEPVNTSLLSPAATNAPRPNAFADLKSEDFLKLLITQLTSQDPLEPTGNAELLDQLSSIRNIELSTTLTDSLRLLTGQQRFASASSLIGQYVTGIPDESGAAVSGIVVGIQFEADGQPVLQLSGGGVMSLAQVSMIEPPLRAAERLVGQTVIGVDRRRAGESEVVEGLVTAVLIDDQGEVVLELDTGGDLRFRDVVSLTLVEA